MTHAQISRELRVCRDVILKAYPEKERIKFVNKNTLNALYNVLKPRKNVQYNFLANHQISYILIRKMLDY